MLCSRHRQLPRACVICGFSRAVDGAHIVAAMDGGPRTEWNIVPLCPNHHRLYDRAGLLPEEEDLLAPFVGKAEARCRQKRARSHN